MLEGRRSGNGPAHKPGPLLPPLTSRSLLITAHQSLAKVLRRFDAGGDSALRLLHDRLRDLLSARHDASAPARRAGGGRTPARPTARATTAAAPLRGALTAPAGATRRRPAGRLPASAAARRGRARRRPTTLPRRLPAAFRARLPRRPAPAGLPARPTLGSRHTSFPEWKKLSAVLSKIRATAKDCELRTANRAWRASDCCALCGPRPGASNDARAPSSQFAVLCSVVLHPPKP
jgi:hypothetical protein